MNTGRLLRPWKEAIITFIHKSGNKTEVTNYRPISLTSQVCKKLARAIWDEIVRQLESNDLIPQHQHGFIHGRSYLTNLLENWTENYNEIIQTDVIYSDFKKAFHIVPVQRLIFKLEKLGLRETLLTWMRISEQIGGILFSERWKVYLT